MSPCEHVDATFDLGSVELISGSLIEKIALVEVHVASQKKLATNRVALRNFVASFLKDATLGAVLAVFHQPGKVDWRLTYASCRATLNQDTLEITSTQTGEEVRP